MQTFRLAALLGRDSNTDVFLRNLQIFEEHLIWSLRTPASETCSFTWIVLFNNLHFWLRFIPLLIIYSFFSQDSLPYYWYRYNQKPLSGAVLQKRSSCKFAITHNKTPKKGSRHRGFLVNSVNFLITHFLKNPSDGCFCINTRSICCPTTTFHFFKNDVSHIFWLSIFSS